MKHCTRFKVVDICRIQVPTNQTNVRDPGADQVGSTEAGRGTRKQSLEYIYGQRSGDKCILSPFTCV